MIWPLAAVLSASTLKHAAIILFLYMLYRFYIFWTRYRRLAFVINKIPGPKEALLFGNALQFAKHKEEHAALEAVLAFAQEYNGIFRLWFGTHPQVYISSVTIAEELLNGTKHLSKSSDYEFLVPWLGTGLLTSTGEKWKTRRKLITPTFHFQILNNFIEIMEEKSKTLVSLLQHECTEKPFDVFPYIKRFTLDVICEAAMGVAVNAQTDRKSTYTRAVARISTIINTRFKSPWIWPPLLFNLLPVGREHNRCLEIMHGFTDKVIDERIAERKQSHQLDSSTPEVTSKRKRKSLAFLDLLIEAYESGQINREGIREEVDTFMFEGHDTTSSGLTWFLYQVGKHPQIQGKVRKEVDHFFDTRPETLTMEDLAHLTYLECVIKESMRIFPPVGFLARSLAEDSNLGGYLVPKGTSVFIVPLAMHRDPRIWHSPMEFDPDRFLPESVNDRRPFSYLPFSAGPRNCVGQRFALLEEKIALAYILHNFTVESVQEFADLKPVNELILRPTDGMIVKLNPRSKKGH